MIASHQEAQFLYSTCEAEWREQAIALHIAQAVLQQAQKNCQYAWTKSLYTDHALQVYKQ